MGRFLSRDDCGSLGESTVLILLTLRSTARWHRGDDPLVQTIRASPQVTVVSPDAAVPVPAPVP
jgi:hypothetical protein